jgi:hypothetical protein
MCADLVQPSHASDGDLEALIAALRWRVVAALLTTLRGRKLIACGWRIGWSLLPAAQPKMLRDLLE